jgi:capsular polysaccharide transport system permease protein
MTTNPTARRFRIRPSEFPTPTAQDDAASLFDQPEDGFGDQTFPTATAAPAPGATVSTAAEVASDTALDAIRREGLTGRQLRMARRVAQQHDLPATSDFDAVRMLRQAGIDPFQRGSMLELVLSGDTASDAAPGSASVQASESVSGSAPKPAPGLALTTMPQVNDGPLVPQTFKAPKIKSAEQRIEADHAADILKIQRDIARRRRRKSALLMLRLFLFVGLPTFLCGWYFYVIATPLYATKSEFVIQQAQNPAAAAGGLGGLLQGSPLATSQDSIAVQGYLQSREAMQRLDADHSFRAHFSAPGIDPISRLEPDASLEAAYRTYKRNVLISYDPTEGLVKMEVIATDPETSATFARALIGYAEGQVDQLTSRLRADQMQGARESFDEAEANMLASQRRLVELQEKSKVLSSEVEVSLITTQIGQLDSMLTQDRLSLQQMESNANPNVSRMEPLKRRIASVEAEIAALRSKLTQGSATRESLAQVQGALLIAQADVQTRQLILGQ